MFLRQVNTRTYRDSERSFHPNGDLYYYGDGFEKNESRWRTTNPIWSARIFVGLEEVRGRREVADRKAERKLDELIDLVRDVRTDQSGDPASSFLYQRGLYTHQEPGRKGQVVEDFGAQVVIIGTPGMPRQDFEQQMVELAESIAAEFDQEEVILDLQRGGISKVTMGVGQAVKTGKVRRHKKGSKS